MRRHATLEQPLNLNGWTNAFDLGVARAMAALEPHPPH